MITSRCPQRAAILHTSNSSTSSKRRRSNNHIKTFTCPPEAAKSQRFSPKRQILSFLCFLHSLRRFRCPQNAAASMIRFLFFSSSGEGRTRMDQRHQSSLLVLIREVSFSKNPLSYTLGKRFSSVLSLRPDSRCTRLSCLHTLANAMTPLSSTLSNIFLHRSSGSLSFFCCCCCSAAC